MLPYLLCYNSISVTHPLVDTLYHVNDGSPENFPEKVHPEASGCIHNYNRVYIGVTYNIRGRTVP